VTAEVRLLVPLEARFAATPDARYWAPSNYGHAFWEQYLAVFDQVTVAARCEAVNHQPPGWLRVDGPGVDFCRLPPYHGPLGFLGALPAMRKAADGCARSADCVLFRGYGAIAWVIDRRLRHRTIPVGLEVVGDPDAALRTAHLRNPLTPLARLAVTRALRRRCRTADAVAYVTETYLQRMYPPGPRAFSTAYSDVALSPEDFASPEEIEDREARLRRGSPEDVPTTENRIVFVGSLATRYKGLEVLLRALDTCRDHGLRFVLEVLGDGRARPAMERLTARLRLSSMVRFHGAVPQAAVQTMLLTADLMVLPSLTEGLPRALLEAMAAYCPVIGTRVGGIPELLHPDDMVSPGDPEALSAKITQILADPAAMLESARRNYQRARFFDDQSLQAKRRALCSHLRALAESRPH